MEDVRVGPRPVDCVARPYAGRRMRVGGIRFLTSGARPVFDHDYARFPGLRWSRPEEG